MGFHSIPFMFFQVILKDLFKRYQDHIEVKKPNNFSGFHENHLKCVCFSGSIVKGVREPILYRFALDKPPGHKIFKKRRIKFF